MTVETLLERSTASDRRTARIGVCVSGEGTNLRALQRAARDGVLGGEIVLVVADRPCRALDFARDNSIPTATIRPADFADRSEWDTALVSALDDAGADLVVHAGFMRRVGPAVVESLRGRILNVHPSLLPAFPGANAIDDALAAGAKVTGVTVHVVDEALDAGPIVAQEAVPILPTDDAATLLDRLHTVEHRLLPRCVALLAAGAIEVDGRRVTIDWTAAAKLPTRRRALLSVSDKTGLTELADRLARLGFELVSTGGTARALRAAGLEVTEVAWVTGFPEMLDGRVKTLHPRIEAGVLADVRRGEHRAQLAEAAIDPFDLVVVNLYPFAAAARRPSISTDELVEEIDIGGPTLLRAAAKNHSSVAVVCAPAEYDAVARELEVGGRVSDATRERLAVAAFRHTAEYDAHIAGVLPTRLESLRSTAGEDDRIFPERVSLELERVERLRYGENPHQRAAFYVLSEGSAGVGPFARGVRLVQGKQLSYNNLLDASAAVALVRDLDEPACVIVKHANPCGAAVADDPVAAWSRALASDPTSAFGGVVALNRPVDSTIAMELTTIFLEVVVAPAIEPEGERILSSKPNLRVILYPEIVVPAEQSIEYRTAGGGLLATESDVVPDDPRQWRVVTHRGPTPNELVDLELAWRVVRHVKSNAIALVRDRAVVGVGAGQMSRVDSAKLALMKAGAERAAGASCASDAFYPFADGLEVCAAAGVRAFIQPGGSQRDAEVMAAADAADATMLFTGARHFRH